MVGSKFSSFDYAQDDKVPGSRFSSFDYAQDDKVPGSRFSSFDYAQDDKIPSSRFSSFDYAQDDKIPSSRFSVWSVITLLSLVITSCDSPAPTNTNTTQKTDSREAIGVTGYTIDLLPGYMIEPDTIFKAYYFKPSQANANESEAGLYIGPKPDTGAPMIEYVKRQYRDVFLGDSVTWTEYATAKYIQREAFVDKTPLEKIHVWCYSRDGSDLARLYDMVKTIQ